jgi:hypothetical protein
MQTEKLASPQEKKLLPDVEVKKLLSTSSLMRIKDPQSEAPAALLPRVELQKLLKGDTEK